MSSSTDSAAGREDTPPNAQPQRERARQRIDGAARRPELLAAAGGLGGGGGGGTAVATGGAGAEGDGKPRPAAPLDREAVLRATALVLDRNGFEKTTIRGIAKELRCAVGSIYRHFTDKNQLLDEVVQGRFTAIAEAAEGGHAPEATTRAFLSAAAGRPEQYRLMFWLSALGRGPSEPAAVPSVMRRLVAAWSQHDQLGSVSEAHTLWARLHGELMLGRHDGLAAEAEAALAAIAGEPAPRQEPTDAAEAAAAE